MKARDVMTTTVISVPRQATVEQAIDLMLRHHVSALPVVEGDGTLAGLISEGDLMRRVREGGSTRRSWWLDLLTGAERAAEDFVKARSQHVADVMTLDVVSVDEETPVNEIARLLERNRIKRVPVLRDNRVVGIVSRANLLHALSLAAPATAVPSDDDRTLREKVDAALTEFGGARLINVTVESGHVTLWGIVDSEEMRAAMRVAAENVPGVRSVEVNLTRLPGWAWAE